MSMYEEQGAAPAPVGQPESELQATAREVLTELGYVWLGDLAGMEVVPVLREGPAGPALQLRVTHRCGNEGVLMANMGMDGMSDDGAIMLGNLVEFAVKWREGHACPPHRPSPEHQARVQRWTDSASGGARPVVDREGGAQAGLLVDGPMTPVDLETEGQRLFRQGRHAEAEIPLAREILGDEAAEQLAARRAEEPADIPVRRLVDGRWQTVKITLSEFRMAEGADGRQPYRVVDGPGCTPVVVRVECLGDSCTGCSDPQCWTARADGGDV